MEKLIAQTGFLALTWREGVMIAVAFLLLWLAIKKEFEPLLLVPIGFGALMTNLPLNGLMALPADGAPGGLFHYLFQGVSARDLPAAHLPRPRGADRLRAAPGEPEDVPPRRGRPARRLRHVPRRRLARLHAAGGGFDRDHRRRRRPDLDLPDDQARAAPPRGDRGLGLLVHGARAAHPAADHAAPDDEEGAADPDGGELRRPEVAPDHVPRSPPRRSAPSSSRRRRRSSAS